MSETVIYITWDEPVADMATGLLEAEGIIVMRSSEMPRSVLPLSVDGLGEIRLMVAEADASRAREILAARFSSGPVDTPDEDDEQTGQGSQDSQGSQD